MEIKIKERGNLFPSQVLKEVFFLGEKILNLEQGSVFNPILLSQKDSISTVLQKCLMKKHYEMKVLCKWPKKWSMLQICKSHQKDCSYANFKPFPFP